MKAELTLPQELVELIAKEVFDFLKPLLSGNSKQDIDDRYLTVKQLSDYTGMSVQWIYNNVRSLPHLNLNRKPLFRKSDIDSWLEQFRVEPQKTAGPLPCPASTDLSKGKHFKKQRAVTSV